MIYNLQYKCQFPRSGGNTYKRKLTAATDAEAWEQGIRLGRSGYRLIAVIPMVELVKGESCAI